MTADDCTESIKLARVHVSSESDPGVVTRLLGQFQNLNITPRCIVAEFATTGLMHIQVDVSGLPENRLSLIAAKMHQCIPVLNAYWHWL